nr:C-type lectin domain family 2 member D-like [Anolis sagrei ordinatus]
MHRKNCYYFSKDELNWTESENACFSRNSSLARIGIEEEDFVKGIMQNKPFWIGLHKSFDQSWKWPNGENATKPAGNGGDCAYLHGSVEANSGRCNIPHRYICKSEVP